jgi:UDP-2,3-diacylglucosamine hydrolase
MATLFISDLHLESDRPDITAQFLKFLKEEAAGASALYILGDLFESWIGDDDPDPEKRRVVLALRQLTKSGVPCYFMHGNRDFLLGSRFARDTGCTPLADGTVVAVEGQKVLLLHGDVLCIDDHSYQRLRRIVRNPFVQLLFRQLPLKPRLSITDKVRIGSRKHTGKTAGEIMDVNQQAVTETMKTHGVNLLLHGHTHRPAIHPITIDGQPATRIVLGDWDKQGSVLRWDQNGYELKTIPRI